MTRGSAVAEGLRDALCELKLCQRLTTVRTRTHQEMR